MTEEKKLEFLAKVMGRGNTTIGQVIMDNHGTMNINNNNTGEQQKKEGYTDEQIAQALTNIVGKNKPIDSKLKWAGAQWLLRWECNYPPKAQDFCEKIASLPLPDDLEYKCEYNNIRALSTLSFMNEDARKLESVKYSKNDEQAFFQLRGVVVALAEELQKTTNNR